MLVMPNRMNAVSATLNGSNRMTIPQIRISTGTT